MTPQIWLKRFLFVAVGTVIVTPLIYMMILLIQGLITLALRNELYLSDVPWLITVAILYVYPWPATIGFVAGSIITICWIVWRRPNLWVVLAAFVLSVLIQVWWIGEFTTLSGDVFYFTAESLGVWMAAVLVFWLTLGRYSRKL